MNNSDFDIDSFLTNLKKICDAGVTQPVITRQLLNFNLNISPSIFCNFDDNDSTEVTLQLIWKILFQAIEVNSSNVKLEILASLTLFMIRITPFYPELMIDSFSEVVRFFDYDPTLSPVIIGAFTYLTKYFSPPFLLSFLQKIQIFKHFKAEDDLTESVVDAVKEFSKFPLEWTENLLFVFLKSSKKIIPRHLTRAIAIVVGFAPYFFIPKIIDFFKDELESRLNLFGFIFSMNQFDIKKIEITELVKASFKILNSEKPTFQEIGNSLLILGLCDNLVVEIDEENNIVSLSYDQLNCKIQLSKVLPQTSFYSLKLPIKYYKINESDSILVTSAKFKSMAKFAKEKIFLDDASKTFENILKQDFNDVVSCCLQSLADCINDIKIDPIELRIILFSPKKSWFHSNVVLKLIQNFEINNIEENFALEIIDLLISFSLDKNASLSSGAISTILKFTLKSNYNKVLTILMNKFIYFDEIHYEKILKIIGLIYKKFGYNEKEYDWFTKSIVESIFFYFDNLKIVISILDFLTNIPSNNEIFKLMDIAYEIIYCFNNNMTGYFFPITYKNNFEIKTITNKFIQVNTSDLITNPSLSHENILQPMFVATKFVYKHEQNIENGFKLFNLIFPIFPHISTSYFYKNLSKHEESCIYAGDIYKKLKYINDVKIHAIWCNIILSYCETFPDTNAYLDIVISYLFGQTITDLKSLTSFCIFILSTYNKGKQVVINYLNKYSNYQIGQMLNYAKYIKKGEIFIIEFKSYEEKIPFDAIEFKQSDFEIKGSDIPELLVQTVNSDSVYQFLNVLEYANRNNYEIPSFTNYLNTKYNLILARWLIKNKKSFYTIEEAFQYLSTDFKEAAIFSLQNQSE